MSSICFIDGDLIKFKLGFVGQKDLVKVYAKDNLEECLGTFKNKTEAFTILDRDDLVVVSEVIPKPWEQVVSIGKAMIRNIVKGSGCKKFRIYVDGEGNFRNDISTIKPYKGTRSGNKPFYYEKITDWLIEEMGAIVICGIEVDDAIALSMLYGYEKNLKYVGATIDKDALGTVGWLYNYDKMEEPTLITPLEAWRAFYIQCLTGDTIDNIPGCRQAGAGCNEAKLIPTLTCPDDMFKLVVDKYINKAERSGMVTNMKGEELDPLTEWLENARLLAMITWKDPERLWHPVADGGVSSEVWGEYENKVKEKFNVK